MSKIENCETNFNLPLGKAFLHSDFRKQGSKTLKSLEINKMSRNPNKNPKKEGLLKEFIQSTQNNKELTTS